MSLSNPHCFYGQLKKKKLRKLGQANLFQNHKNDHGQTSFASYSWTELDFSSVQNNVFNSLDIFQGTIKIKPKPLSNGINWVCDFQRAKMKFCQTFTSITFTDNMAEKWTNTFSSST